MSEFTIRLKNCAFFARHGVYSEEEKLGQRFFVDAKLWVIANDALANDDIDGTVDYGSVFQCIEEIITGQRHYLIESLAYDICEMLLKEFPKIKKVSITIRKPNAPIQGVLDFVEVNVIQQRKL